MPLSALIHLRERLPYETRGGILLRADETYQVLPPTSLPDLKRLVGRKTVVINIHGDDPTKPTVLIVANEDRGPKRLNRRATILLRGTLAEHGDVVFGDAVVTQILNPLGRVILRAKKALSMR